MVPVRRLIVGRLADLLLDTSEALALIQDDESLQMRWVAPHLQSVLDELSVVVSRLSD